MRLVEAVGNRIRALIDEKRITCYKLAKDGGIPRQTIAAILNGKNKTVSLNTIFQITETLGVSLDEFFHDIIFNEVTE